jgi:hypothetical protein
VPLFPALKPAAFLPLFGKRRARSVRNCWLYRFLLSPLPIFVSRLRATRCAVASGLRPIGYAWHKMPEERATGSDERLQQRQATHAHGAGVRIDGGNLIRIRLKSRLSFWFFTRAVLRGPVVLPRRGWPFPDGAREIALRPGRGCVSAAPPARGAILPRSWRCRRRQGCSRSPASPPRAAAARHRQRL